MLYFTQPSIICDRIIFDNAKGVCEWFLSLDNMTMLGATAVIATISGITYYFRPTTRPAIPSSPPLIFTRTPSRTISFLQRYNMDKSDFSLSRMHFEVKKLLLEKIERVKNAVALELSDEKEILAYINESISVIKNSNDPDKIKENLNNILTFLDNKAKLKPEIFSIINKYFDLFSHCQEDYQGFLTPENLANLKIPPSCWGTIGDYYTGNLEMQAKRGREGEILKRLSVKGQEALYDGATDPNKQEDTSKREAFIRFYAERLEQERKKQEPKELERQEAIQKSEQAIFDIKAFIRKNEEVLTTINIRNRLDELHGNLEQEQTKLEGLKANLPPLTMNDALGKEGVEKYQAALKEENNSPAFRRAVFLAATTNYLGLKFKEPIDGIITGASGTGKTYATDMLIKKISLDYTKDLLKEELKNKVSTSIFISDLIRQISNAKDMQSIIKALDGALELPFFKNEQTLIQLFENKIREIKTGNDVVSVDGAYERKMSQVRQIMLQGQLSLRYEGISDLHSQSTALKLKSKVGLAALNAEGESLNTVRPTTLTNPTKNAIKTSDIKKQGRRPIVALVMANANQTKISGINRAFRTNTTPYEPKRIKMNIMEIGCESKEYKEKYLLLNAFETGFKNSLAFIKEAFKDAVECYTLNNIIVHVRKTSEVDSWEVCTVKNRKFDLKLSKADFDEWKQQTANGSTKKDLRGWHREKMDEGKLKGLTIIEGPPTPALIEEAEENAEQVKKELKKKKSLFKF